MKNIFSKNDKYLFHAFVLTDIIAGLILVSVIVSGALLINSNTEGSPMIIFAGVIIIVLAAPIAAFTFLVFSRIVLNAFCDLKLIRNKLYGIDNDYLKNLVSDKKSEEETEAPIASETQSEPNESKTP